MDLFSCLRIVQLQNSQPIRMQKRQVIHIFNLQLFPKFPYAEISFPDIDIMKKNNSAGSQLLEPIFKIMANSLIGMQAINMKQIN